MRVATRCIAAVLEVQLTIAAALGQLAGEVTVLLLGVNLGNDAFLRLEVEGHRVVLVSVATHLEHGSALQSAGGRITSTRCVDEATVEHHEDLLALQVHVLVFYVGIAVEIGTARCCLIGQRVVGCILDRRVDAILAHAVHAVEGERVVNHLIIIIDGQLKGVHRRGVALQLGSSLFHDCRYRVGRNRLELARSRVGNGQRLAYYRRVNLLADGVHHLLHLGNSIGQGYLFRQLKGIRQGGILDHPFYGVGNNGIGFRQSSNRLRHILNVILTERRRGTCPHKNEGYEHQKDDRSLFHGCKGTKKSEE